MKRYIDTELFKQAFVRSLPTQYKALWVFLFCDCDNAGVWQVDIEVAELYTGAKFSLQEIKTYLGAKLHFFANDKKAFIPDFISFQYGNLNEKNPAHKNIIATLQRYDLTGILKDGIKPGIIAGPKGGAKFIKPTFQEVADYVKAEGLTTVDPADFIDTYEANGWKIRKDLKPMSSWQAAARRWHRDNVKKAQERREQYNEAQSNGSNRKATPANRSNEVHTAPAAGENFITL